MKKTLILISIGAVALIFIIWFFKPMTSNKAGQSIAEQQPVLSASNNIATAGLTSENQSNNLDTSKKDGNQSPEQEPQLYDTKSDLSIQPIDPEKDVGNQISHSN